MGRHRYAGMAVWLDRLAMVMSMRIKVNVADLPKPPYTLPKYRSKKPMEIPKDARIVTLDYASPPTVQPKKRRERKRKNMWTPEDEKKAMDMYWDGAGFEDIAKALGRTPKATRTKINILRRMQGRRPRPNIEHQNCNAWQVDEDETLLRLWNSGMCAEEISKTIGNRTRSGIASRLMYLREHTDRYIRYGKGRL